MLVAVGAAAGALARWRVAELFDTDPGRLPWETLLVNMVGCLLIGVAAARVEPGSDRWLAGMTGVLGGFTTFSAFANETRTLLDADRAGTAFVYVGATLAGGLAAVALGRRVGA
jgi:CrcB protein